MNTQHEIQKTLSQYTISYRDVSTGGYDPFEDTDEPFVPRYKAYFYELGHGIRGIGSSEEEAKEKLFEVAPEIVAVLELPRPWITLSKEELIERQNQLTEFAKQNRFPSVSRYDAFYSTEPHVDQRLSDLYDYMISAYAQLDIEINPPVVLTQEDLDQIQSDLEMAAERAEPYRP